MHAILNKPVVHQGRFLLPCHPLQRPTLREPYPVVALAAHNSTKDKRNSPSARPNIPYRAPCFREVCVGIHISPNAVFFGEARRSIRALESIFTAHQWTEPCHGALLVHETVGVVLINTLQATPYILLSKFSCPERSGGPENTVTKMMLGIMDNNKLVGKER